jgi:hypothetical protein
VDDQWLVDVRAHRTPDDRIDGAVLSVQDIDELKNAVDRAQIALRDAERASTGVFVLFVQNLAVCFCFSFKNIHLKIIDSAKARPLDAKSGAFIRSRAWAGERMIEGGQQNRTTRLQSCSLRACRTASRSSDAPPWRRIQKHLSIAIESESSAFHENSHA